MARARTLNLNVKANVTGADKLRGLGDSLQSTGRKMTTSLTLPIVALGGAMVALASRQEDAERKMTSAFESMGAAAWTTTDAIKEQASALQQATTFGDEAILEMQAVLLTFGNVTGDAFEQGTQAALNMSAALGTDLQAAAIQVGKALNDPIQGVAALRRVGVQLSDQQQQMVRDFVAAGDVASAQAVILGELERQFGGMAEAMAQTTSGQIKQAMNALGDAGEQFGAVIAPLVAEFAGFLKGVAEGLQSLSPEAKRFIVIAAGIVAALGPILFISGTLIKTFLALKVAFGAVGTAGLALARLAPMIGASFHAMLGPIGLVTGAIALLAAAFATDFLGIRTATSGFVDSMAMNFGDMRGHLERLASDSDRSFREVADAVREHMEATGDSFDVAVRKVRQASVEMSDAQREMVDTTAARWEDMQGIYSAGAEGVVSALTGKKARVSGAAKSVLEEPLVIAMLGGKEEAERIASETPGGIAKALLDAQFEVEDAASQLTNVMERALSPAIEKSRIIAFLSSKELALGLADGRPAVRAEAQRLKEEAEARLALLNGFRFGANLADTFAGGIFSRLGVVRVAAGQLAQAATGQIGIRSEPEDRDSPLYGLTKWGANLVKAYVEGIERNKHLLQRAFGDLVAPGLPAMSPVAVSAVGGAGVHGEVHYHTHYELRVDGVVEGTNEDKIRRLLQRMTGQWDR